MPLSQYEQRLTYGFTFCADNQAAILIPNRGIRCGERTWTQQPRNRKNATAPSAAETISFSFLQHLSTWWCGICSLNWSHHFEQKDRERYCLGKEETGVIVQKHCSSTYSDKNPSVLIQKLLLVLKLICSTVFYRSRNWNEVFWILHKISILADFK